MQLLWSGPVFGTNAYAKSAQNILTRLHALGLDVKISVEESTWIHLRNSLESPNPILLRMVSKPKRHHRVHIHHTTPERFQIDKTCRNIGITYCETDTVSDAWVRGCNKLDLLLVGSTHNQQVFRTSGVSRQIELLPHGVDKSLYSSDGPVFDFKDEKIPEFKFLSVFEWTSRKGYDLLIQAFCEEFTSGDNVALIIKTIQRKHPTGVKVDIPGELNELINRYRQSTSNRAPIYLYSGILDDTALSALYRACDAFVLPSRGEGIGLPYLEAGSCGLPVIATAWGGQMDLLTDENSFLCDYDLKPISKMYSEVNPWHIPSMKWAEPKVMSLREQMRLVYQKNDIRKERAEKLQKTVQERYTWDRTARMLAHYIKKGSYQS